MNLNKRKGIQRCKEKDTSGVRYRQRENRSSSKERKDKEDKVSRE